MNRTELILCNDLHKTASRQNAFEYLRPLQLNYKQNWKKSPHHTDFISSYSHTYKKDRYRIRCRFEKHPHENKLETGTHDGFVGHMIK